MVVDDWHKFTVLCRCVLGLTDSLLSNFFAVGVKDWLKLAEFVHLVRLKTMNSHVIDNFCINELCNGVASLPVNCLDHLPLLLPRIWLQEVTEEIWHVVVTACGR